MFNPLHSILDQELFEKHFCNPCIPKERNDAACPSYINYRLKSEVSITLRCPLRFVVGYVQPVTQQYESRTVRTSAIKIASMKNTDDFRYEGKPSCATTKSTLFAVSKDEWDTKEDTGKSMKNALYVLWYAKRHLLDRCDAEQ